MVHSTPGMDPMEKLHWVGGHYVEGDALRIAERINEYDPRLRVQYLEEAGNIGDPPFRVVERCEDGIERTVMYAWELNSALLDRIMAADTFKVDIQAELDKKNAEARRAEEQKTKDSLQEAREINEAIIRTPKDTYTVREGDKVIKIKA